MHGYWLNRQEWFEYRLDDGRKLVWDITRCLDVLASFSHEKAFVSRADLARLVAKNRLPLASQTVPDLSRPGIAAPLLEDGRLTYRVIDGSKRAAAILLTTTQDFPVLLLTAEESRACLVSCEAWEVIP